MSTRNPPCDFSCNSLFSLCKSSKGYKVTSELNPRIGKLKSREKIFVLYIADGLRVPVTPFVTFRGLHA